MGTTHASQSLLTSARTTGQTVLDSDGKLKWALHNLVLNSSDLSDAAWSKTNLETVSESGDGHLITATTSNNVHAITDSSPTEPDTGYVVKFRVTANGARYCAVGFWSSSSLNAGAGFDLQSGTVDAAGSIGAGYLASNATITEVSTGVYDVSVTVQSPATTNWPSFICRDTAYASGSIVETFAGDGSSGFIVSRASLYRSDLGGMQNGSDGTDYVETSGSAVYHAGVAYDGSGACLGMQSFEGRTNLLLNSATLSTQSVTTTNVPHTLSFKGTGTITLTGTSTAGPLVGTGSGDGDRVELTFTPTAGSLTCTVSGTVEQAQLEAGSFLTPYIPTTSAATARGADSVSLAVADFGFNASEGTIVAEFQSVENSTSVISTLYANSSNLIEGYVDAAGNLDYIGRTGGVSQFDLDSTVNPVDGVNSKASLAYKTNDIGVSVDAQTTVADASATIPTVTHLYLGSENGLNHLNGYIKSLAYYPVRLVDATLEAESA